ncbi:hypothetical protein Daus18300_007713 [Diaporthe australafricana]|uniref:SH3 domain-containing protein n=1 Tax=Diaporthe australafricana TaxID=127596 RepID=A0ABR3WLH0_9PEZI
MFYFRLDWRLDGANQAGESNSSWSQNWAIADNPSEASSALSLHSAQRTAGADPVYGQGPASSTSPPGANGGTATSTTSGSTTPSATSAKSGSKSGGLATGALVGIVVGCVGGVILLSVVAGCFCFRRRRNIDADRSGSRGVQDIIAEKEARASILDKDQPDTPYSEQNSQHPLNRDLGMAARNESGVDLGIGQAISGEAGGSVRSESLMTRTGGNDRNSAVYSSLGGGAVNSAHGTPVASSPTHDRSSAVGSPVPRASSQQERSFSPYSDRAVAQHHHVVDGADLVQQEHSNDSTARSPSSVYSSNPLDELQPISPESAPENGGAAGGGGGGGMASQQQPRAVGHVRSTTPSGISGQYAHLVEEGMTDDEIRRLEEEERALDEAIEQAGTPARKR